MIILKLNIIIFLAVSCTVCVTESKKLQLLSVFVIFRHGDRAPDPGVEMFPNDPHLHDSFEPMGLGGLTNAGKKREFNLGRNLRKRYKDFLGNVYNPYTMYCRSTDYARTKMSLQLVLTGLFPPQPSQEYIDSLNYQSIEVHSIPSDHDNIMIAEMCPQYLKEFENVQRSPAVMKKINEFRPFMKNLTRLTGKTINTPNDMYYLYHSFMAESSMGLELVDWAKDYFPYGKLRDGTILEYEITSYNTKLRRLYGGMLLRYILENMAKIINTKVNKRKLTLLSGHETNVASLLLTLGVFKPHVPEYSSAVIFELLTDEDDYYVKVYHYLGIPPVFEELQIPGCKNPCSIKNFILSMTEVIPSDMELVCSKTPDSNFLIYPRAHLDQYIERTYDCD